MEDSFVLDFIYSDMDSPAQETAEFYSYSNEELDLFAGNRAACEELLESFGYDKQYTKLTEEEKKRILERIADEIENADHDTRIRAVKTILYLAQGNFGECLTLDEQPRFARKNIFQLYDLEFFPIFIQLIHYEMENAFKVEPPTEPSNQSLTHDPNTNLKLLVSIVYLFVSEMNLADPETDTSYHSEIRARFKEEISQPICGELLHFTLFEMVFKLCNRTGSLFPMKKILLLLWKLLLLTFGGSDRLRDLKNEYRNRAGLWPVPDDTIEVARRIRPASPPPTAVEMIDSAHQRKLNRPFKRQTVVKQSSFGDDNNPNDNGEDDVLNDDAFENGKAPKDPPSDSPGSPRPSSPVPSETNYCTEAAQLKQVFLINNKSLPWIPKIRQREIDIFLAQVRKKFIGYALPEMDRTTTAGLPPPILESIDVLKKHLYESLGELQIRREDEIARFPLTVFELDSEAVTSFPETLYRVLLPNLPKYLVSLLKLLLASVTNMKSKNDMTTSATATTPAAANVLCDIGLMPQQSSASPNEDLAGHPNSVLQTLKQRIDLNRHQEIIIKAISSILLLLLKHYKINHIYQFEYISQQLMFANCIPLVIKFISQEVADFIVAKNSIPVLDFPACVIGEQAELTPDNFELLTASQPYCWRNMFSSINLLRILNKLTKWKNCRIMMLVLFKSAQPLKRSLRIRHAMFQVYALKLLKMQAKFLGRQWRKNNMKTMSAIYQKVRHRLNDDWAFANDVDSKQLYFQTEEFLLQANINRFHNRRYEKPFPSSSINSVAAQALSSAVTAQNNLKMGDTVAAAIGLETQPTASAAVPGNHFAPGVNPTLAAMSEIDLFNPVDNNLLSVLSREVELTSDFKQNYETWLEREVFCYEIDWDRLLRKPTTTRTIATIANSPSSCASTIISSHPAKSSAMMHSGGMMTIIRQPSGNGSKSVAVTSP